MKTLIIAAHCLLTLNLGATLLDTTSAYAQTLTIESSFDTDTLYPSPSIVIPYHTDWTKTHYIEKIAEFKANPLQFGDIVFIGNSITEQGGNWVQRFDNAKVKNRGIAGDVTAGVINRLAEIYYYKPEKVFIEIGINDLFQSQLTPEYVANNIKSIVTKIHLESPDTKIYVQTILPTANNTNLKGKIKDTNAILKSFNPTNYLQIIDLYPLFANSNDVMISSYTTDGIHLTESGYVVWQNFIKEFVNSKTLGFEELNSEKQYVLYPNPVYDILSLKNTNGLKTESLKIMNISGETVYYNDTAEEKNFVNVSKLSPGIYIVIVTSINNNKRQFKFIKK